MLLDIRARAAYDLPADTFVLLMVEPPLTGPMHRVASENLTTTPTPYSELWTDNFGNPQRRLGVPAGPFSFDFSARVEAQPNTPVPESAAEHAPRDIPPEAMVYTLPSRYCQSDRLVRLAQGEFGSIPPGGGASWRSPSGSAPTSSIATGPPTPRPRPPTRRSSGSACAATSPTC